MEYMGKGFFLVAEMGSVHSRRTILFEGGFGGKKEESSCGAKVRDGMMMCLGHLKSCFGAFFNT